MAASVVPTGEITRRAIRTPRAAAVAGIAFALLLSAVLVLVRVSVPADINAAGSWITDPWRRRAVLFALNLLPFAGIAFLWFIGVVRDRIGAGEDRFFATVFLGSGLLFIAMLFVTGAVSGGLVETGLRGPNGLSPDVWGFGRRVSRDLLIIYAMRMAAVFTISTTTLAIRLRLVPRWLAIYGYVTALALLVTLGQIPWIEITFPLWVLVLSIHILVVTIRTGAEGPAVATA